MEFSFEKLEIWKVCQRYVISTYNLLRHFPQEERFALCDQIRRSTISVPSNIVEGTSRTSKKEKIHFLEISYSSLMESFCQFCLAKELGYISEGELSAVRKEVEKLHHLLRALRQSYERMM